MIAESLCSSVARSVRPCQRATSGPTTSFRQADIHHRAYQENASLDSTDIAGIASDPATGKNRQAPIDQALQMGSSNPGDSDRRGNCDL